MKPDFSGWATKNNILCSDGRTIMPGAFQHQDGAKVPLVWNHNQDVPGNVMGYGILTHKDEGVWIDAYLNSSASAEETRELIKHGDVGSLSIRANRLQEKAKQVFHGMINEVSVVLTGANPGALIQHINLEHSADGEGDDAIIFTGLELAHAEGDNDVAEGNNSNTDSTSGETVADVVESMNEKQKKALYYLVGQAAEGEGSDDDAEHSDNDESLEHSQNGNNVTRNTFSQADGNGVDLSHKTLSHAQRQAIINDAQKMGSLHDAVLMHAEEYASYGVNNLELLFPDAKAIDNTPEFIKRQTEWVTGVLNGVDKRPFSRIKSLHSDITHEEARARGYIRGNLKKEEFFGITSRETTPTTIYKKQKLDRDDIIDVTTLDLVKWVWGEMRLMLNEEIARAILIGDGRPAEDPANPGQPNPDKIAEPTNTLSAGKGIRSIANDHEFYAYQHVMANGVNAAAMIKDLVRQRRHYKGTGTPKFYTTTDIVTDMLLLEDKMGRALYETRAALAAKLNVSEIVEVEVFESDPTLVGIIVNLRDYVVGTDKGGEITTFDDFDIDYNQYKYLIEGRMSGALVKHRTALVIRRAEGTEVVANAPTFDSATNTITIVPTTGVVYTNAVTDAVLTGDVVITEDTWVQAEATSGHFLKANSTTEWAFTFNPTAGA